MTSPLQYILAALAAFAAGLINALAGGGTLITFPALTALGLAWLGWLPGSPGTPGSEEELAEQQLRLVLQARWRLSSARASEPDCPPA